MALIAQRPYGTQDFLPDVTARLRYVENTLAETARRFGFAELRTPIFEHTELFVRSVGDTSDVVQKEMYTFTDKGGRSLTLKPEQTAATVRAALEGGLMAGALPVKLFYIVPCFRQERPQAGRFRQFHQFGIELLGASDPGADAEVISLARQALARLGVGDLTLNINSIGCPKCRPAYHKKLAAYLSEHESELCETCRGRLATNPLRVLDCKEERCKRIADQAPVMLDALCPECATHFDALKLRLDALSIAYNIDPTIVRGLDYYTKTVFEFKTDVIGAQSTVCGGGRYDGLVSALGGAAQPGIGFGLGLERLLIVMEKSGAPVPEEPRCDLFIASMGEAASVRALTLASLLRAEGFCAQFDTMNRSLKAQLRYADKLGARYSLVLGENELAQNTAKLKRMSDGASFPLPLGEDFLPAFYRIDLDEAREAAAGAGN